ncbi:ceramide synthase 2 [Folsomia candida]|uniref:ceramide synthase 2 n=1 Tax=Folsomia candida TaxID=158441 RepID=UPI000B8EF9BC|nr:ceramide synthase 2 [Folsomia candida]
MGQFLDWFWNPEFWLPPGMKWTDLRSTDEISYPDPADVYYTVLYALVLIAIRYLVERLIFNPLGQSFGLKAHSALSAPEDNPILETAYKTKGRGQLSHQDIEALAKRTDLKVRQIERWFRKRSRLDRASNFTKFSESGWRCTCYVFSVLVGLCTLWEKPYFWDFSKCWYNFPHHSIPFDLKAYYLFEFSMYWSLLITISMDVKRKDFWEMFAHHVVTLTLMALGWFVNLTRMACIILLLHDTSDIFLEAAKMGTYVKKKTFADVTFSLFAIVWIITRLWIFPFYIAHSSMIEAPKIIPMFPAYYVFNGMVAFLIGLHVFWTYFIFKVIRKALASGEVTDTRSSSESSMAESEEDG